MLFLCSSNYKLYIMRVFLLLCVIAFEGCTQNTSFKTLEFNKENFEHFKLDSTCKDDESSILFKDKKIDFGVIKRKDVSKLLIYFPYVNIGNSKLVILKADVSCGCLSTTYPKRPLGRGEVGAIEVLVNLKNQQGVFNKTVFIKSNAINDVEVIRIRGVIK